MPTKGGITQARKWLGPEPMARVFSQVAGPVADLDTIGAFPVSYTHLTLPTICSV